jgi:hypothetical protein
VVPKDEGYTDALVDCPEWELEMTDDIESAEEEEA